MVLSQLVPGSYDAGGHVVETLERNGTIQNGAREVVHPVARLRERDTTVSRHIHIETCKSGADAADLSKPIRHDETLETELVLEKAVDEVGILTTGTAIDSVVCLLKERKNKGVTMDGG